MYWLLKAILTFHHQGLKALEAGKTLKDLVELPVKEKIAKAKMVEEKDISELEKLTEEIKTVINK